MLDNLRQEREQVTKELEKSRLEYLKDFQKGIDMMFGVGLGPVSEVEKDKILKSAEEASNVLFKTEDGDPVYLSEDIVRGIIFRLGEEKTREYLSVYKSEVEEKVLENKSQVGPDLKAARDEARSQLFINPRVGRIVF